MKRLVISAFALAAMVSGASAGEPVTLTDTQLDKVAAAGWFSSQSNSNFTSQFAAAAAHAQGGCIVAACFGGDNGNAVASATAVNANSTHQINID